MLRVYVACSSRELDRAEAAIRKLRSFGIEVTYDYVDDLRFIRREHPTDATLSWPGRLAGATRCLDGVRQADLVWLLVPETETRGFYVEFGVALERRRSKRLAYLLASPTRAPTAFLEEIRNEDLYSTDDLALQRIVRISRGEVAA